MARSIFGISFPGEKSFVCDLRLNRQLSGMHDHLGISAMNKILLFIIPPLIIGIAVVIWAIRRATTPPREKDHKK
jgi:hypothetical protein